MPRPKRSYDHRLRDLVRRTRDLNIAISAGVPRSTAAGWLSEPRRNIVTVDALSMDEQGLRAEVLRLRRCVQKLRAVVRILVAVIRAFDIDLGRRRLPDGESKSFLLSAIERARAVLKLRTAMAILGLSPSRFHAWKRVEKGCGLDDHSSCPNTTPHRLTIDEIESIKEMVTSTQFRHVPTGTLSVLAQPSIGRRGSWGCSGGSGPCFPG